MRNKVKELQHDKIIKINGIFYEKIKINSVVIVNVDVKRCRERICVRERERWQGYC